MALSINRWTRKLHRWGAIATSIPILLVVVTGLMLQLKKQVRWVQPPTQKSAVVNQTPNVDWSKILKICNDPQYAEAKIERWSDIERMDVRPGKGIVKVRAKTRWEIQIDLDSGDVLQYEYRRSDLIESLHDGSFFGDYSKLIVFLANGLILLGLWCTGLYLWYLPFGVKRKKQKKLTEREKVSSNE